MEEKYLNIS